MVALRGRMVGAAWVGLVLVATAGAGCQCNRSGMTVSAEAKTLTITAPPGRGGQSLIEVIGNNFAPNEQVTLSFRNYPALDPSQETFQRSTWTDSQGHFAWQGDFSSLPQRNFSADPGVDVWVTAKEVKGGCFAMSKLSTQSILTPPLK